MAGMRQALSIQLYPLLSTKARAFVQKAPLLSYQLSSNRNALPAELLKRIKRTVILYQTPAFAEA